jgi:hypothetical protein
VVASEIGLTFLVVVLVVVVVGGVLAGAVALAMSSRRERDAVLELVPGRPSGVPVAWAGAHTPEARAYRRLAEAARAVRSVPGTDHGILGAERAEIDDEAERLGARLVAAAAVPGERRTRAVAEAVELVDRFEAMVADLVMAAGDSPVALDRAVTDVGLRLEALREARLEVERIDRAERQRE